MFNKTLKYLLIVAALFMLAGCVGHYYQRVNMMRINTYYANLFSERLEKFGVSVFRNQTEVTVILPKKIFIADAANFTSIAPRLLDEVGNLLKCYEMEVVKVVGVMPDDCCGGRATALAAERAHKVIKYFGLQDVNISLVYADGQLRSQITENMPQEYVMINFHK